MSVSFDKNGATGSAPATLDALVDTAGGTAVFTLPQPSNLINPSHMLYAGWTGGGRTRQPGQATIATSEGTTTGNHTTLTLSAAWSVLTGPTMAAPNVHAAAGATPSVDVVVSMPAHQAGDTLNVSSAFGSGWSVSQPYATAGGADTLTWSLTPSQLRSGWDGQYKLSASMSRVDPATGRTVGSDPDVRQAVLPYVSVGFDRNNATTGTAPAGKQALVDTPTGKAWFTLPDGSGMGLAGKVFGNWATAADGTGSTFPSGAQVIPTTAGTTANGKTTVTLYAIWVDLPAPTGVSATWKRDNGHGKVSFTASGLPMNATGWDIRVKGSPGALSWSLSYSPIVPAGSFTTDDTGFTPGATWTAEVRSNAIDSTGAAVTSGWTRVNGVLPYMTVALRPGSQQQPGGDGSVRGLIDSGDRNAYVPLPGGIGTPPPAQTFGKWNTTSDGTGTDYPSGNATAVPSSAGTPGGDNETLLTLYARWIPLGNAPKPGHCGDSAGWQSWGAPYGHDGRTGSPTAGLDRVDAEVCWTIQNDTLRLTGGTSPNLNTRTTPWDASKPGITGISIEGDLTLTGDDARSYSSNATPFGNMPLLTRIDDNGHPVTLDKSGGSHLFYYDQALPSVDLTGWKTGTATAMDMLFIANTALTGIKGIGAWDTHSLQMFGIRDCTSLTTLDLSRWDTTALTSLNFTFDGDTALEDLDISGWDTTGIDTGGYNGNMNDMLPANLKRLRLGPRTRLTTRNAHVGPFSTISQTTTWHTWDWPQGHHPIDQGPVADPAGAATAGTLDALKARAASANPQGTYIRTDVNVTYTDLKYDLNGGTGDNALPTTISTTDTTGLAIDTTFRDGTYTIPGDAATHITANRPHALFQGWSFDTTGVTGGAATISNHTLTAPKGAGGAAAIDATWQALTGEASGTVDKVNVTTNTPDQGTATVKVSANLPTGDTSFKACVKPSSQSSGYAADQCQSVASSAGGQQTMSLPTFSLPGSLTAGQSTTFPGPGLAYTMTAMYTVKDPATNNSVDSEATQAGSGLTSGTLAYASQPLDVNTTHGGSGTAPGGSNAHDGHADALIDTGSGTAWIRMPGADGMHGYSSGSPTDDHGVFQGWATSADSTRANACTPNSTCALNHSTPVTPVCISGPPTTPSGERSGHPRSRA
ncbi:BspA family leucine-rich repeat surface protein [Bifidobacterium sp. ESL0682]|uniref:BspA family leucine-rich repeat surface protein n=1 Tax=Bifidobacterium sp. ESL0682 TaxID=2983212 RepID=UPI0023F8860E|nr:BspA family leucine-rich repeat surface protein [Bifidobacterium sp. ESL0682]WEV42283.1 BspA family leucine-rich repeat surface protein [Bifidobacterium sp. ESL0682]